MVCTWLGALWLKNIFKKIAENGTVAFSPA
jgi:hypothetical protein